MEKPIIVYVSGAPGSGKTTLARLLSDTLYLPLISSDLIQGGVAFLDPAHDRKQTFKNVFVPTIAAMAQKGVSLVTDQVLRRGVSEADIIDKLRPYAHIINVHTKAENPIERYIERIKHSDVPSVIQRRNSLLERAAYHKENLKVTNEPLDLDLPLIVVHTDNGYNPALDEIVAFIRLHSGA